MQSHLDVVVLVLASSVEPTLAGCEQTPVRTVPGPEAVGLVDAFEGHILMDRPVGGLVSVSIPSRAETELRVPGQASGTIRSVSGPDERGRIVYIENHMLAKRHRLVVADVRGGPERVVFEHEGDALWGNRIGDYLALSPDSGLVASVMNMSATSMSNPDAYLKRGTLVLWNIEDGTQLDLELTALEDRLSWFPDGERVVYVDLVPRWEALQLAAGSLDLVEDLPGWEEVQVVHVLDVETAETRAVSVGQHPLASVDGRSVLIENYAGRRLLVDVETRRAVPVDLPGITRLGPIGFLDEKHVLYWAYPTEGNEERWTEHNSPLVGKKSMLTLKLAEWNTNRFETVVPFIDPRRHVSFGRGKP